MDALWSKEVYRDKPVSQDRAIHAKREALLALGTPFCFWRNTKGGHSSYVYPYILEVVPASHICSCSHKVSFHISKLLLLH